MNPPQIYIVHLSDLHFGNKHRFNPPATAAGDSPMVKDYPSLLTSLAEDLEGEDPGCPVVVCITGDLTESGTLPEFEMAEGFIRRLAETPILGRARGLKSIFFVPGNHDVKFDSPNVGERWQQYTDFFNRITGESVRREDPWSFDRVEDRVDEFDTVVLCLNSSIYVEKGKDDELRGRLEEKQLEKVKRALEDFDSGTLASAIKIVLIHHHPVLIPALVEPGRGYDAVHNSGPLLTILREYGFQLILHGHKHHPHTFTHDVDAAFETHPQPGIMVVGGGSVGANLASLPTVPRTCNCYNRIMVKWHPTARQSRIRSETRGLSTFDPRGRPELPTRWRWHTLKVDDRSFLWGEPRPDATTSGYRPFGQLIDGAREQERKRINEYQRTRGNLPVIDVMPSLVPKQAYEARAWIVHHDPPEAKDQDWPIEVTWSAGPKFPVVTIRRTDDPRFCAVFNYWGPMLIQACLTFADGKKEIAHIYARMPADYAAARSG